jgi:predicted transcriptional regulator
MKEKTKQNKKIRDIFLKKMPIQVFMKLRRDETRNTLQISKQTGIGYDYLKRIVHELAANKLIRFKIAENNRLIPSLTIKGLKIQDQLKQVNKLLDL